MYLKVVTQSTLDFPGVDNQVQLNRFDNFLIKHFNLLVHCSVEISPQYSFV